MKKAIVSILTVFLASCSFGMHEPSKEDIVKNNIVAYLQDKLDDPQSYELVSLELIDSTTYLDNINYRKRDFEDDIKSDERLSEISSEPDYYLKGINRSKRILAKIDSIQIALGDSVNCIAAYKFIFKFRSKNSFGAKVLNEYILQTTGKPSFDIIQMTNDPDKVYLNPNEFPGYRDMAAKELGYE
nr:MAG TPA: TRAF PROTEIN, TRAO PROTEIN, TRAN ADHESION, BACTERIAL SECRETION.5A [Bacteriophage sp.]